MVLCGGDGTCRGPGFDPMWYLRMLPVTPVPGYLPLFFFFFLAFSSTECTQYPDIHASNTLIFIKLEKNKNTFWTNFAGAHVYLSMWEAEHGWEFESSMGKILSEKSRMNINWNIKVAHMHVYLFQRSKMYDL